MARVLSPGRMLDGSRAHALGCPADVAHPPPDRVTRGDQVMWLAMGRPPADSSPMAQLMVAYQELYEDLHEFVKLKRSGGWWGLGARVVEWWWVVGGVG